MRLMYFLFLLFTANSFALEKTNVTANWAEQYIKQNHPSLMVDSQFDHVLSVYYFGQYGNRSLLGLERRSEEHTSELQSRPHLVCRLLLEKKNKKDYP